MAKEVITAGRVARWIEEFAPPELREDWDNAGFQIGRREQDVHGVLVALDVTRDVVAEAKSLGCDMIVAHHPILFRGARALPEDEPDGALIAALIRGGFALYTAHTALDRAQGGVNDEMAHRIGLKDVQSRGDGFVRIGAWGEGTLGGLAKAVREALGVPGAVLYGAEVSKVRTVALCSGSGMSYLMEHGQGADAFVTGDVTHHDALDALAKGVGVVDAGHRGGELLCVQLLARGLQKRISGVECSLQVHASEVNPYAVGLP